MVHTSIVSYDYTASLTKPLTEHSDDSTSDNIISSDINELNHVLLTPVADRLDEPDENGVTTS